jgi:uncharacterized membrane protein YfcA
MTGAGFAARARLVLSAWERGALLAALFAGTTWAIIVLLGEDALPGAVGGGVGGLIGVYLGTRHGTPTEERRAVAAALREHRDPGGQYREATTRQARVLLATRPVDRWLPLVLLVGMAVACVVAAIVRDDLLTALPAVLLVAVGGITVLVRRRTEAMADRWLAEPPPVPEELP